MKHLTILFLFLALNVGAETAPCTKADSCHGHLKVSTGKQVQYWRTHPLSNQNPSIENVTIVIHGAGRNADEYFEYTVKAASLENRLEKVAVLAPRFLEAKDMPTSDEHYWSGGWREGNLSKGTNRISSYEVVDEIMTKARVAFPNLKSLSIVGHSAGGQFVNRYVAGSHSDFSGLIARFVVLNPSTYLYLTEERPTSEEDDINFMVPEEATDCPNYNEYKYGVENLNAYMKATDIDGFWENLSIRESYYFGGTLDTGTSNLDQTCEANLQGKNRFARFNHFRAYTRQFPKWNAHFAEVPDIAHSGAQMIQSKPVRKILFSIED